MANFRGELQMAKKEQKTYWIVDPIYDLRFFCLERYQILEMKFLKNGHFAKALSKVLETSSYPHFDEISTNKYHCKHPVCN